MVRDLSLTHSNSVRLKISFRVVEVAHHSKDLLTTSKRIVNVEYLELQNIGTKSGRDTYYQTSKSSLVKPLKLELVLATSCHSLLRGSLAH